MKNKTLFLAILFITALSVNNAKAQYTMLTDFTGNGVFDGPNSPQYDQNFISDGTYLYGMTSYGGSNNLGTVFKIKISDNSYTKILDFAGGTNGLRPYGSLISDGTFLYGMTAYGGLYNVGTVFKIKISDNTYTKIFDFDRANSGRSPFGSLFSDGTYLYGMTIGGGTNDLGTAFKIKLSDNTYTKLLDFNGVNGSYPHGSLISDGTYLYGMSFYGGSYNFGTAFKIKLSDNTYTNILDFSGTANGSSPYGSLISDGTYLYGMTYSGGSIGWGTAFKIKISDNSYTKILDFNGTDNGRYPYGSFITDGTYLYGMTLKGGTNGGGTTFKIKISDNSYSKILDFPYATNGSMPYGSLISEGTYLYGMTYSGGTSDLGTAFKINISDNSYTKILDFAGATNGSSPYGSLISDGTFLYGMTYDGGASNLGTAFKINISDNTYTKILDFDGGSNGKWPNGSLISDGTYLYGMSFYGGTNNMGTVFKIKLSDNSFTKILDFSGATNGNMPYGSLISDGTFLYGMSSYGGTNNMGTVFKIKLSDNSFTKILDFNGTNGSYPYGSLVSDGTYLYGMSFYGGSYNFGTAFKIKFSDNTFTKILDFAGATNGSNPRGSLIADDTYLYGMTSKGGTSDFGTVFKIKLSDNAFTKILDFTRDIGSTPYGSLVTDGTYLYGMTSGYDAIVNGTVFRIKISNNMFTQLLRFTGAANQSNTRGSLITDGTYLYGMTYNGGSLNIGTVFKYQLAPEINVKQGISTILDNTGTYSFGSINIGTPKTISFTIENNGLHSLNLSGTPKVIVSGTGFTLTTDAPATISEGSTGTFEVTFTPNACGAFSGTISIVNDDVDENPYNFAISGTGLDNIAPVTPTLADVTGECSATAVAPTTTDNCAGTVTGTTTQNFPITFQGTTNVTWTFNDGNGNSTTAIQKVIIDDITNPETPILADITGECSATATAPTTTDNCAGTITGTTSDPLTYSTTGTHVIAWKFDDGNGNSIVANQNVIIDDVTNPETPTLVDLTGECSATATPPTTIDNCAGTLTGTTSDPLTYSTQGTYIISWTFDDGNGNSIVVPQNVIVVDVTNPETPTLADVTGECSATATPPTTTDNCAETITGTTSDPLTYSTQGTHIIAWTFDDGNGNSIVVNQNVIVDDVTNPETPTLADVTGECSATATPPTTTDNCAGTITGTTSDPLTYSTQGTHIIAWTFDDGNGNSIVVNQNVIVDDVTNPVTPVLDDVIGICSIASLTIPTTTDNCAGTITATTSDPVTYAALGTYVIAWTFDDGNGNSIVVNQNLIIDDVTDPTINCIGDQTITLNEGETFYTVSGNEFDPIDFGDNCGIASVINDFNSITTLNGITLPIGTTLITWTISDLANNELQCSFTVQVNAYNSIESLQQKGISMYPNPTIGIIKLEFTNNTIQQIKISDLRGKTILEKTKVQQQETIDLSGYASGVYIISFQTDKEVVTANILKE